MGLFERFPYTNFHELNAGWMLEVMKKLEEAWEQFTAGNSLSFADPLTYDATKSYAKNTIVLDSNGNAYISLQTVPKGVATGNQDYWLMVFDYEAFMEKVNKNFTGRYYRDENRAKTAMAVGDWLTFDDVLCKATAAIAVDDLLEEGTNIEAFTLEDFIKAFMLSTNQLIQQYKNDIDASELAFTQNLQEQFNQVLSGVTVDSEVINARVGYGNEQFVNLGEAIRGQINYLALHNIMQLTCNQALPQTSSDVTLSVVDINKYHIQGTATGTSLCNITVITPLPKGFEAGKPIYCYFDCADSNVYYDIFSTTDGVNWSTLQASLHDNAVITIPATSVGLLVRSKVNSGITVNTDFTLYITNKMEGFVDLSSYIDAYGLLTELDLNNVYGVNQYYLLGGLAYTNKPADYSANTGFLEAYTVGPWTIQKLYSFSGDKVYKRRASSNNSWSAWETIGGVTNYNTTYNVSPSFPSDTGLFLASTGDNTDVTAAIEAALTAYKVVRLGAGVFYVDSVDMPDDSCIIGSGEATEIHLISGSNKYAFKLGNRCSIKDLTIIGNATDITVSSSIGTRNGIVFESTYSGDNSTIERCILSNLRIKNIQGSGILCNNTGYPSSSSIFAENIYINLCDAGINIKYWSEYHRFTNTSAGACYYGCICNGGNCIFTSCNFSSNKLGLLMDNTGGVSPNNSHGAFIGCSFNHIDNNTGIGIKLINIQNGEIFEGCQLFGAQIELDTCKGIVFSDMNISDYNNNITITNGSLILFKGCIFQAVPTGITVTGNTDVHFSNCYTKDGSVVTA